MKKRILNNFNQLIQSMRFSFSENSQQVKIALMNCGTLQSVEA